MNLDKLLKTIEERASRATAGPWVYVDKKDSQTINANNGFLLYHKWGSYHDHGIQLEDTDYEFIAASRTDVPRLVEALRLAISLCGWAPSSEVEKQINQILSGASE